MKRPMTSTTVNNTTKASYPQVASAVALYIYDYFIEDIVYKAWQPVGLRKE